MTANPNGRDCNELIDGDYYLADGAAWFTVGDRSVRIRETEAGVFVGIYKLGAEDEDAVAETFAHNED